MKLQQLRTALLFSTLFFSMSIVAFAQPDADKPIYTKDVVHLDDLIVDGSVCVGQDCVNGENFGFDTHRLKENNLRLHFDDTSNSASFPGNDWRIVINDSANGGANYFGIEDATAGRMPFRVLAGAPVASLYVHSNGNIGMGTSTPGAQAHMKDGNTPTLRLEQDGSSGFTPQTWDVAGNEANFFVRDVTNGSTLPFRIKVGAPSSSIYINDDGKTFIGTSSASTATVILAPKVGTGDSLSINLQVNGNALITRELEVASDERFKKDITPIIGASGMMNLLHAVSYNMNTEEYPSLNFGNDRQYGLLAQDVEKVLPDLVSNSINIDGIRYKSVNYMQLMPFIIQAFQEQEKEIKSLNSIVFELIERLEKLEKK